MGEFLPFTAQTRMSGLDLDGRSVRKGAGSAVAAWVTDRGGEGMPPHAAGRVERIAQEGGTPLVVAEATEGEARVLGAIRLSDVVKPGIAERFAELRAMGIRAVMITGDNPLTARSVMSAAASSSTRSPRCSSSRAAAAVRSRAGPGSVSAVARNARAWTRSRPTVVVWSGSTVGRRTAAAGLAGIRSCSTRWRYQLVSAERRREVAGVGAAGPRGAVAGQPRSGKQAFPRGQPGQHRVLGVEAGQHRAGHRAGIGGRQRTSPARSGDGGRC